MKVLLNLDIQWPLEHSFVDEVFKRRANFPVFFIYRSKTSGRTDRSYYGNFIYRIFCLVRWAAVNPSTGIIIFRNSSINLLLVYVFLRFFGCKIIYFQSHDKYQVLTLKYPYLLKLRWVRDVYWRLIEKLCDSMWFVSEVQRKSIIGDRSSDKVHIFPLGVPNDIASLADNADKEVVPHNCDRPIFIYAGTFNAERNLKNLIDSFERYHVRKSNGSLILIGGGPSLADENELKLHASTKKNVFVLDRVSRAALYDLMRRCDVGVCYLPSKEAFMQNSPIKLAEYAGLGVPVVCTPQPEHSWYINRFKCGVVASSDRVDDFAIAMEQIVRHGFFAVDEIISERGYDGIAARVFSVLRMLR